MSGESVSGGQTAEERTPVEGDAAVSGGPAESLLPISEASPPVEPTLSPVRFNAVKHGIFSVSPVVPWLESEEDWLAFRDSIFADFGPEGGLEMALADRVAMLLWRMMRIVRFEREAVAASLSNVGRTTLEIARIYKEPLPPPGMLTPELKQRVDRAALAHLLPDEPTLNRLMGYEMRLHRQLLQTLRQLSTLQGIRRRRKGWFPVVEAIRAAAMGDEPGGTATYFVEEGEARDGGEGG